MPSETRRRWHSVHISHVIILSIRRFVHCQCSPYESFVSRVWTMWSSQTRSLKYPGFQTTQNSQYDMYHLSFSKVWSIQHPSLLPLDHRLQPWAAHRYSCYNATVSFKPEILLIASHELHTTRLRRKCENFSRVMKHRTASINYGCKWESRKFSAWLQISSLKKEYRPL